MWHKEELSIVINFHIWPEGVIVALWLILYTLCIYMYMYILHGVESWWKEYVCSNRWKQCLIMIYEVWSIKSTLGASGYDLLKVDWFYNDGGLYHGGSNYENFIIEIMCSSERCLSDLANININRLAARIIDELWEI